MKQRQNSGSLCGVIFQQAIFQQEYLLNSVYVPLFQEYPSQKFTNDNVPHWKSIENIEDTVK